jgi:hypothetical protein
MYTSTYHYVVLSASSNKVQILPLPVRGIVCAGWSRKTLLHA